MSAVALPGAGVFEQRQISIRVHRKEQLDAKVDDMRDDVQKEFEAFHIGNPHVYRRFIELSEKTRRKGREGCVSPSVILKGVTWILYLEFPSTKAQNILDKFAGRYARMLEKDDPTFRNFFRLSRIRMPEEYWRDNGWKPAAFGPFRRSATAVCTVVDHGEPDIDDNRD